MLEDGDKKLLQNIEKHGWQVVHVPGDSEGPDYAFTIGLFKTFQHPELIMVGLKGELMHEVLNHIGETIRAGKTYIPEIPYSDILQNYKCLFKPVHKKNYRNWAGYAVWHYKGYDFPLLQLVWPDPKGKFPMDPTMNEELKATQPLLDEPLPERAD